MIQDAIVGIAFGLYLVFGWRLLRAEWRRYLRTRLLAALKERDMPAVASLTKLLPANDPATAELILAAHRRPRRVRTVHTVRRPPQPERATADGIEIDHA